MQASKGVERGSAEFHRVVIVQKTTPSGTCIKLLPVSESEAVGPKTLRLLPSKVYAVRPRGGLLDYPEPRTLCIALSFSFRRPSAGELHMPFS